jgi:thiamine-phosphate pyrophosphorylase
MRGRLDDARLYLVAPARIAAGRLADLVSELVDAGVDVVQLREKELEVSDVLRVGEPVAAACKEAGVPLIVNDRADVALALEADGVHLGQDDGPVWLARRVLGERIVGLSTHSEDQIEAALRSDDRIDYVAVGPVQATPTKPGRPAAGLGPLRHAARRVEMPWFAIGGIGPSTLPEVLEAGARRIVVVRAITEAPDPPAAAARLKKLLDAVPLEE